MMTIHNPTWRWMGIVACAIGLFCLQASAQEKKTGAKPNQEVQERKAARLAEATSASMAIFDESLRDDPILPREERIRRHKLRLGLLEQRQFQEQLNAASSGTAQIARQRLSELHKTIEKRIHDLETSLTKERAVLKEAEAKTQGIRVEDTADSNNLAPEERTRRKQLREQFALLAKASQTVQLLEAERQNAEDQLRQIEARLAALGPKNAPAIRKTTETIPAVRAAPVQLIERPRLVEKPVARVKAKLREQPLPLVQAIPAVREVTTPTLVAPERPAKIETVASAAESSQPLAVPRSGVLGFARDRALDLCDLLRLRIHIPKGFRGVGLKARATCLAQAGFLYFDGTSAGMDRRGMGIWRERRLESGVGPLYFSKVADEMIAGNRYTDIRRPWSRMYRRGIVRNGVFWDDGRLHPVSGGAELHLFVVGLELEAYPLEWLDAALGWVGLDPFNDDESRILRRWHQWQTIPELRIHDEWQETYKPPEEVPPPTTEETAPAEEETGKGPEETTGI